MKKNKEIIEGPSLFPEWNEETRATKKESDNLAHEKNYDHTALFERLAQSAFRSKFKLSAKDKAYIQEKGVATIRSHAADFVAKRLAPASKHPCGVIRSFLLNMLLAVVAENALPNGITYRQAERSQPKSSNMR